MFAIAKREVLTFFTTPIGYTILGVYYIFSGLFLWFFSNSFNLIQSSFADLNLFFELTPWLLLFLIPAIGMKSFSEEIKSKTIELLFTKPISLWELVIGKFLGILFLVNCVLLSSFIYSIAIIQLKFDADIFDWGAFWGSYFGLFLLASVYSSIIIWCSSLTKNQVVAFLSAVLICLLHYYGWSQLALYFSDNSLYTFINSIGISVHYGQMSKGIIDTKDIVYFFGQLFFFLYLTVIKLKKHKN